MGFNKALEGGRVTCDRHPCCKYIKALFLDTQIEK